MAALILFSLSGSIVIILFVRFLITGIDSFRNNKLILLEILTVVAAPFCFLMFFDVGQKNDCCLDSALFSPSHGLSIYVLITVCVAAYFYCRFRKTIAPPIAEIVINSLLVAGIILNVLVSIHVSEMIFWLLGNVPVIILFISAITRNHNLFIDTHSHQAPKTESENLAWKFLHLKLYQKLPVFIIIFLPVSFVIIVFLLLFGQRPDSFVRAFTDTYKHGLSQLDYQCEGVVCGGHYLCTIAAKGHTNLVKPVRTGIRGGKKIVCNRQLLISNAFEELLENHLPLIHRPIRKFYDVIGSYVERYYQVLNNKFASDFIYLLMKPLEWFFLLILYTFDKRPENRIATQYLSRFDRQSLKNTDNQI